MQQKTLFKYEGTVEGKPATWVSLMDIPYARATEMVRLIADPGMVLSNDKCSTWCTVIDVMPDDVVSWAEYPDPDTEPVE